MTESSFIRIHKERLPAFERANYSKLLASFFGERVGLELTVEKPRWLVNSWIYYKPDSKDSICPYENYMSKGDQILDEMTLNPYNMETDDTKLYDRVEALTIWLERKGE